MTTEITNDSHTSLFRDQPRIANLPTDLFARYVANRVAVKADQCRSFNGFGRQRAKQRGDGIGMMEREVSFDACELQERNIVLRGFQNASAKLAIVRKCEAAE